MKRSLRERLRMRKRAYVPNTFIKGLSLSTKEIMAAELAVSVNMIKAFSYDAINDVASCYVRKINLFEANDGKYNGNNDLLSFVSTANGVLRPYNEFRNANSITEIRLPNLTYSNSPMENSFNFQCANLEILDVRSITRLQQNYIYSAPKLKELNVESVVYADKGAIRGVPLLMLIDMKKCKFLGTDASASPTSPIFTGLNPNVTINLNYALMTSNDGEVDIYVVGLKVAYPNSTINFYDDDGNFVETYNPQPELYTQNDACSIGANETESIGVGWTYDGIINQEVVSSSISEFAIKFTLPANDYSHCLLQLTGLEVGETYIISFSVRCYADDGVADGGGFFRATTAKGWSSLSYADFNSVNWTEKSFESSASVSNPVLELYPAWLGDDPQAGWFAIIDNISIKKISDSPIDPENPEETIMSFVDYNIPTPLPGYLNTFTEENFGRSVTRISDASVFGGIGPFLTHDYSKRQVWNSDQSYISLSYRRILDGTTYELLGNVDIGNMGWSNTQPLISYGTSSNSNYFNTYELNPSNMTNSLVASRVFSDYNILSHHTAETNISADDRYVSLYGTRTSTGDSCWVVIYDILNDDIISETNIGTPLNNVNWVSMSQSGNFVVVQFNTDGNGTSQGTKSYNRSMVHVKNLSNRTPHADIGYDLNGNEVFVFYDLGYLQSITLNGIDTAIQYVYMQGGHVSCRNIHKPGWAYVSDDGDANVPSDYPAFREIFAVKLDEKITGKTIVNRFTKHYTKSNYDYEHYAMACASPDGTKVIFKSNMTNATVESQTYPFAWVVEAYD